MQTFREDLVNKFGQHNFEKIQKAKVGIAGAGGLGSNCALHLVRVGFTKFTIADFDVIVPSNLDRQFYFLDQIGMNKVDALRDNLVRINPELELELVRKKIEKINIGEIFSNCDIIAECLDRAEYKTILVSELMDLNKFIVSVSGLGGVGFSDEIKIHRINNNLIIIGDLKSDTDKKPALSPRVNIAAAKQADVILEYVLQG
ncbi:MAG: sulfur carrier protein ThiS adenylyltransferase ThiF [Candidatus Omnitrophota bacterium]